MQLRRVPVILGILAGLTTTACGPKQSFDVSLSNVPENLLFGNHAKPSQPARQIPANLDVSPGFPPILTPPMPVEVGTPIPNFTLPSPSAAPACPALDPLVGPDRPADSYSNRSPWDGDWAYRQGGYWSMGGKQGPVPVSVTRTVTVDSSPPAPPSSPKPALQSGPEGGAVLATYQEAMQSVDAQGDTIRDTTTYGLQVKNHPTTPVDPNFSMAYGAVVILEVKRDYVSGPNTGKTQDFQPNPAVTLVQYPLAEGASWSSNGASSTDNSAMFLNAGVSSKTPADQDEGRVVVNLCGTPIEAWKINILPGSYVVSSDQSCYTMGGYYDVATEQEPDSGELPFGDEIGPFVVQQHIVDTFGVLSAGSSGPFCDTSKASATLDTTMTANQVMTPGLHHAVVVKGTTITTPSLP